MSHNPAQRFNLMDWSSNHTIICFDTFGASFPYRIFSHDDAATSCLCKHMRHVQLSVSARPATDGWKCRNLKNDVSDQKGGHSPEKYGSRVWDVIVRRSGRVSFSQYSPALVAKRPIRYSLFTNLTVIDSLGKGEAWRRSREQCWLWQSVKPQCTGYINYMRCHIQRKFSLSSLFRIAFWIGHNRRSNFLLRYANKTSAAASCFPGYRLKGKWKTRFIVHRVFSL